MGNRTKEIEDSRIIELYKELKNCCKVARKLNCSYALVRYRLAKNGVSTKNFKLGNFSEEHRKNLSKALMGNKNCLGHKHTEEFKEKNRQAHLGKTHSEKLKRKMSILHAKEKNANWKGGSRRSYNGEARRILEKHYGVSWDKMYLPEDPLIHHINGNYKDQRISNLCIMSRSEHTVLHHKQGDIHVS